MNKFLIVGLCFLTATVSYAQTPCPKWSQADFASDIQRDGVFELWKNGKNTTDTNYTDLVTADTSDPAVIAKAVDAKSTDSPAEAACKAGLVQDGKISPTKIVNNYIRNLYANRGCTTQFKERPTSDVKSNFSPNNADWLVRMAYSAQLYKKTNGSILFLPSGGCASGSHCIDTALIKYKDASGKEREKRVDVKSAYSNFCGNTKGLERSLASLRSALAGKPTACMDYLLASEGVAGFPTGRDNSFAPIELSFDDKEKAQVSTAKTNISHSSDGKTETYGADSTHSIQLTRDSSNRVSSSTVTNGKFQFVTTFDHSGSSCHPANEYVKWPSGKTVLLYDYAACKNWNEIKTADYNLSFSQRSVLAKIFSDPKGFRTQLDAKDIEVMEASKDEQEISRKDQSTWDELSRIVNNGCDKIAVFIPPKSVNVAVPSATPGRAQLGE